MSRTCLWISSLIAALLISSCTAADQPSGQLGDESKLNQERDLCSNISGVQEKVPPDKKRDRWTQRCVSHDQFVKIKADRRRQNRIMARALQAAKKRQNRAERELQNMLETVPLHARSIVIVSVLCDNPSAGFGTMLSEGPEELYSLKYLAEQYSKYIGDASIDLPGTLMGQPEGGPNGAYDEFCPSTFAG